VCSVFSGVVIFDTYTRILVRRSRKISNNITLSSVRLETVYKRFRIKCRRYVFVGDTLIHTHTHIPRKQYSNEITIIDVGQCKKQQVPGGENVQTKTRTYYYETRMNVHTIWSALRVRYRFSDVSIFANSLPRVVKYWGSPLPTIFTAVRKNQYPRKNRWNRAHTHTHTQTHVLITKRLTSTNVLHTSYIESLYMCVYYTHTYTRMYADDQGHRDWVVRRSCWGFSNTDAYRKRAPVQIPNDVRYRLTRNRVARVQLNELKSRNFERRFYAPKKNNNRARQGSKWP